MAAAGIQIRSSRYGQRGPITPPVPTSRQSGETWGAPYELLKFFTVLGNRLDAEPALRSA